MHTGKRSPASSLFGEEHLGCFSLALAQLQAGQLVRGEPLGAHLDGCEVEWWGAGWALVAWGQPEQGFEQSSASSDAIVGAVDCLPVGAKAAGGTH